MLETNFSLARLNTFGMDVRADMFFSYDSVEALRAFILTPTFKSSPRRFVLGGGSNVLFLGDYHGLVLHPEVAHVSERDIVTVGDVVYLTCPAGTIWDEVVRFATAHGYGGSENLSLIPGTVGASVVQNIGAYGVEVASIVERVEALSVSDGTMRVFTPEECAFAYRYSIFKGEFAGQYIITSVTYRLTRRPRLALSYEPLRKQMMAVASPTILDVREAVIALRRAKLPDPEVMGSAGSFFKNPVVSSAVFDALRATFPDVPHYPLPTGEVKIPAAWLIEQCGWKGRSLGRAASCATQPLVLVNLGGASPDEIVRLAAQIVADVQVRFAITLSPEVIYVA